MSFFQLLLMGGIYGLIGFGSFKMIVAARRALKDTQASNRRFVESLNVASRQNLKFIQHLKMHTDKGQNQIITFEIDNHLFKITRSSSPYSLTCIGFHREHYQQVLSFTYHFTTGQCQKQISSQIIRNEEKDIPFIERFIQVVTSTNWTDMHKSNKNMEKKDYTLVDGSINNADIHVSVEETSSTNDLHSYLANIKESVEDLPPIPLKNIYREILLNLNHLLSSEIELDSEKQHALERIVKKELLSIHRNYLLLSPQSQRESEPAIYKNLDIVNKYILQLLAESEKMHKTNLEIQLRLNEENYKK